MTKKFGWCLPGQSHVGCPRKFKSTQTGKVYECDCQCHVENDKALKELI